jgi:hypothetical protein
MVNVKCFSVNSGHDTPNHEKREFAIALEEGLNEVDIFGYIRSGQFDLGQFPCNVRAKQSQIALSPDNLDAFGFSHRRKNTNTWRDTITKKHNVPCCNEVSVADINTTSEAIRRHHDSVPKKKRGLKWGRTGYHHCRKGQNRQKQKYRSHFCSSFFLLNMVLYPQWEQTTTIDKKSFCHSKLSPMG